MDIALHFVPGEAYNYLHTPHDIYYLVLILALFSPSYTN